MGQMLGLRLPRCAMSSAQLALLLAAYWTLVFNPALFGAVQAGGSAGGAWGWGQMVALACALLALNTLLAGVLAHRWLAKPLLALLTVVAAAGSWFIAAYGATLDPSMMRNVLHTDVAEAQELISTRFVLHMLVFAGVPAALISRVQLTRTHWQRAVVQRALLLGGALVVVMASVWAMYQPLSSLMRNHKELRYLITPANVLWSTGVVLTADARGAAKPREPIGLDAKSGPSWAARKRPLVVVLVVGETARAANWGLNGYARQTTPQLAQSGVINFSHVTSCGTNTEMSLPCMFAPVGRRAYDEARIRGQQSLLHVLARAGVLVNWRDNQSGCKGVCDGLPTQVVDARNSGVLCDGRHCLDEALTQDVAQRLEATKGQPGTHLWVLHMLGNHGPAYFRRHPPAHTRFQPECQNDDLRRCSQQEVINAYDNALLYTDHVLANAIRSLQAAASEVDSALVYVSDHGESLGEHGLYLHGLPYVMAPEVQKRVPMVWWHSTGFERATGLPEGCLSPALTRRSQQPLAHDHLFHTLLGALDVRTALHEPTLDLTQPCRSVAAQ